MLGGNGPRRDGYRATKGSDRDCRRHAVKTGLGRAGLGVESSQNIVGIQNHHLTAKNHRYHQATCAAAASAGSRGGAKWGRFFGLSRLQVLADSGRGGGAAGARWGEQGRDDVGVADGVHLEEVALLRPTRVTVARPALPPLARTGTLVPRRRLGRIQSPIPQELRMRAKKQLTTTATIWPRRRSRPASLRARVGTSPRPAGRGPGNATHPPAPDTARSDHDPGDP